MRAAIMMRSAGPWRPPFTEYSIVAGVIDLHNVYRAVTFFIETIFGSAFSFFGASGLYGCVGVLVNCSFNVEEFVSWATGCSGA